MPVGVTSTLAGSTPRRITSSATMSVPQATRDVGAECRLLTRSLEPRSPPGSAHRPLLRLPHEHGRDEQHHDRHAQRPGEVDPRSVEQLVALPDELELGSGPRLVRVDWNCRARRHSRVRLSHRRLGNDRYSTGVLRETPTAPPLAVRGRARTPSMSTTPPGVTTQLPRPSARKAAVAPSAGADPARDRSLLPLGRGGQDEDRTCGAGRWHHWPSRVTTRAVQANGGRRRHRPQSTAALPRWPGAHWSVHVVTRSNRRGAEVVVVELADALDELGHHDQLVALVLAFDGDANPRLEPLVESASIGLMTQVRAGWRLRRMLDARPADVVIAVRRTGRRPPVRRCIAGGAIGRRVWQRILDFPDRTWHGARLMYWRLIATRFDATVVLSAALDDEMRRLRFRGPVWTIPNARNPARFEALDRDSEAAQLRANSNVPPTSTSWASSVISCRRSNPSSRVDVLASVRKRGCPVHLVVAGDGPLHAKRRTSRR